MKNLIELIQEKLKVNSNTKVRKNDIKISFNKDVVDFPNKDIDDIINFAYSLPIIPDEINYNENNNDICMKYLYEDNVTKPKYVIIFNRIQTNKIRAYRIEYYGLNYENYIEYPSFPKVTNLNNCFEYIEKNFNAWIK